MVERFFGSSLESTAKFYGWIAGITSAIFIIVSSVYFENVTNIIEDLSEKGIVVNYQPAFENDATSFIAGMLVFLCFSVVTNFCLVLGTNKRRHILLLPWLTLIGITTLLHLFCLCLFFHSISTKRVIIDLLVFAINFRLWNAMRSLYVRIKAENKPHQFPLNAEYILQ